MSNQHYKVRCRGIILFNNMLLTVVHAGELGKVYALPGGHLELGENVDECIVREIKEELDIEPKIGRLLYVHVYEPHDNSIPSLEFFYEITNGEDYFCGDYTCASHAYEIEEIKWVSKDENVNLLPSRIMEDHQNGNLLSDEIRYIYNAPR